MRRAGISPRFINSYKVYREIFRICAASSGVRGRCAEIDNPSLPLFNIDYIGK